MTLFALKVNDVDLGFPEKVLHAPHIRLGARGIVRKWNLIAILHKKQKNEYKLPGGGIDAEESPEIAFEREILEEVGVKVTSIQEIGTITEEKGQENFKQISFVFVADFFSQATQNFTQQEIEEGSEILWMSAQEALNLMRLSYDNLKWSEYDNLYRTQFMIKRDIKILEYYLA